MPWLAVLYGVASLACLLAYGYDKAAARQGRRRLRESTLLLLGLAGGWPGALLAQHWLQHKTAKASFLLAFWVTVLLNLAAAGSLLRWTSP